MYCEGCSQGIENQSAHLNGCLKRVFTIVIHDSCIETSDMDGIEEIFYITNTTRYKMFFETFKIIENALKETSADNISVATSVDRMYDVFRGKLNTNIAYYSFYLRFTTLGVILKPFKK
jgi:hypothetical protein